MKQREIFKCPQWAVVPMEEEEEVMILREEPVIRLSQNKTIRKTSVPCREELSDQSE